MEMETETGVGIRNKMRKSINKIALISNNIDNDNLIVAFSFYRQGICSWTMWLHLSMYTQVWGLIPVSHFHRKCKNDKKEKENGALN